MTRTAFQVSRASVWLNKALLPPATVESNRRNGLISKQNVSTGAAVTGAAAVTARRCQRTRRVGRTRAVAKAASSSGVIMSSSATRLATTPIARLSQCGDLAVVYLPRSTQATSGRGRLGLTMHSGMYPQGKGQGALAGATQRTTRSRTKTSWCQRQWWQTQHPRHPRHHQHRR